MKLNLVIVLVLLGCSSSLLAEIYKYKDASGKWFFTDKKPKEMASDHVETIKYAKAKERFTRPNLKVIRDGKYLIYQASNPFHAIIQCFLKFNDEIGVKRVSKIL